MLGVNVVLLTPEIIFITQNKLAFLGTESYLPLVQELMLHEKHIFKICVCIYM